MKCSYCGHENPSDYNFCENCGKPLSSSATPIVQPIQQTQGTCPFCGYQNPQDNKFCENCGKELPSIGAVITGAVITPPSAEKVCSNCGNRNPPDVLFCEKCGLKLVGIQPPPVPPPRIMQATLLMPDGSNLSFTSGESIGRTNLARFINTEEASWISRNHFSITLDGAKYFIEDVNSLNGTKLNGIDIKGMGRQEIKDGDTITVADVLSLTFKIL